MAFRAMVSADIRRHVDFIFDILLIIFPEDFMKRHANFLIFLILILILSSSIEMLLIA